MPTVMVVDDSKVIRKVLVKIFKESTNLDVVAEAENGLEAYDNFKKYKPDLVTMDMIMPVMNGVDALAKILRQFPDATVVMVSAMNKKHMVINAIQNGAKSFILKPINKQKILDVVVEIFGKDALVKSDGATAGGAAKKNSVEPDMKKIEKYEHRYDNFNEWVEKISDVEYYELFFMWKKRVFNKKLDEEEFNKKVKVVFDAM